MSYRHPVSILLALAAVGVTFASSVHAEEQEELGHAERAVLGWHPDTGELFVRLSSRGERMIGGESQSYFFATTELYGEDGALIERYKAGPAVGPIHQVYFTARPASDLVRRLQGDSPEAARPSLRRLAEQVLPAEATGLEELTLKSPVATWHSPSGKHTITVHGFHDYAPYEHPFRGTQQKCVLHQRAVLIDAADQTARVIARWSDEGEPATRLDDALCPRVQVQVSWHPAGSHWALTLSQAQPALSGRTPEVRTGRVEGGQNQEGDEGEESRPLLPLVRPLPASEAEREGAVGPFVVMRESGEIPRARQLRSRFSRVLREVKTYEEALLLGSVMLDVDPALAVEGLRRAMELKPEDVGAEVALELLVEGLVSVGKESEALEVIEALEAPSPGLRARAIELSLRQMMAAEAVAATARLLFDEPGNCRAYLVHGQALGRAGRGGEAFHQFLAAFLCDRELTDALYFWADLVYLRGGLGEGRGLMQLYLMVAKPRRGDDIRQARRARFMELLESSPPGQ